MFHLTYAVVLKASTGGACLYVSFCRIKSVWLMTITFFSSVLFYLISPIPLAIARKCGSDDYLSPESSALLHEICYFISACVVVSGFGLPFVLARQHVVSYVSLSLF